MNIVIMVAVSLGMFLSITAAFLVGYSLGVCKPRRSEIVQCNKVFGPINADLLTRLVQRTLKEELK